MLEIREISFEEVEHLLLEADKTSELSGFVYPDDRIRTRFGIYYNKLLAGFFTPRQDPDQVWRMGAIYIKNEYRSKGIASQVILIFMANKRGRAFIEDDNVPSQKAYLKAGFNKGKIVEEEKGAWFQNYK